MTRGRSFEKLIPLYVGSIINYFSSIKKLTDAVDLSQLRTMALETADPIHWPLPQTSVNCLATNVTAVSRDRIRTAEY